MTPKEKFDACMKQAEFAHNSFSARRNYEWKVTLGLWAVILLVTQFLYSKPPRLPLYGWFIVVVAVMLLHWQWLRGVWLGHQSDKIIADEFRAHAVEILRCRDLDTPLPPRVTSGSWAGVLKDWATQFQLFTTILLTAGCVLALATARVG